MGTLPDLHKLTYARMLLRYLFSCLLFCCLLLHVRFLKNNVNYDDDDDDNNDDYSDNCDEGVSVIKNAFLLQVEEVR